MQNEALGLCYAGSCGQQSRIDRATPEKYPVFVPTLKVCSEPVVCKVVVASTLDHYAAANAAFLVATSSSIFRSGRARTQTRFGGVQFLVGLEPQRFGWRALAASYAA